MVVNVTENIKNPLASTQSKGQNDDNATAANQKAIHHHLLAIVNQGIKEISGSQLSDYEKLIEKDMATILAMVAMLHVLAKEGHFLIDPQNGPADASDDIPSNDKDENTSPTGADTEAPSIGSDIDAFIANFMANFQAITGGNPDSFLASVEALLAKLTGVTLDKSTLPDLNDKGVDLTCSHLQELCGGLDPKFVGSIAKMLINAGVTRKSFESLITSLNLPPKLSSILQAVSLAIGVSETIDRMPNPNEQAINQMIRSLCDPINSMFKGCLDNPQIGKSFNVDIRFKIDFNGPFGLSIGINMRVTSGANSWESAMGINQGPCSVGPGRTHIYD